MKKLNTLAAMAFAASLPLSGIAFAAGQADNPGAAAGSGAAATGTQKKISSDFDQHDRDGDDKITQEEASRGGLSNYFVAIDKDKDGQVNKDEFDSFSERYPSLVDDNMEEAE